MSDLEPATGVVHHLALASDWTAALAVGEYAVSTRGRTVAEEGFMHLSFPAQVQGVAERYYADVREPLVLLDVDTDLARSAGRFVVEPANPADPASPRFPHLYAALPTSAVVSARPARFVDGRLEVDDVPG